MKRRLLNIIIPWATFLLHLFIPAGIKAQYDLTISKEIYTNLAVAPFTILQGDGYYFNPNFTFPVFDRIADFNVVPAAQSQGAFISPNGYVAVYEKPEYLNTVSFQCFFDTSLHLGKSGTVRALMSGIKPNRIAKIEWRDLVRGYVATERVNFQVWLHEADSSISYHYGANTLSNHHFLGYCGIIVLNQAFTGLLDEYNLEGNPASPVVYKGITSLALPTLDSVPEPGTVFTFKRSHNTSVHSISRHNNTVYPNPCNNELHFAIASETTASLYDLTGSQILQAKLNPYGTLDLSGIPCGIYMLKMEQLQGTETIKIVKQ